MHNSLYSPYHFLILHLQQYTEWFVCYGLQFGIQWFRIVEDEIILIKTSFSKFLNLVFFVVVSLFLFTLSVFLLWDSLNRLVYFLDVHHVSVLCWFSVWKLVLKNHLDFFKQVCEMLHKRKKLPKSPTHWNPKDILIFAGIPHSSTIQKLEPDKVQPTHSQYLIQ